MAVPNPGVLGLSGNRVKRQTLHPKRASTQKLTIVATGSVAAKLKRTGKVTVTITISFTPTGGIPSKFTKKVTLVRRHR